MGGPGSERDVSLNMGAAIAEGLKQARPDLKVEALDLKGPDFVLPSGVDLVFNALPGTFGEDGQLQAELERRGVPYTGTGITSSAMAFDKIKSKERFRILGVPTPEWLLLDPTPEAAKAIPYEIPFVIKPPEDGSSVGVSIIQNPADIEGAIERAKRPGQKILVEKFVRGRELTVGVLGDEVLPVVEIRPKSGFYDYQNKYTKGQTEYLVPAPLTDDETRRVQGAAWHAFQALDIEVYGRVDVLLDEAGEPWVLEINTIPGMTATSLLPKAAAVQGYDFPSLCRRIAELSLACERQGKGRAKNTG